MNVQSSTRRRALLSIYEAHHKGRNGILSLRLIEREWKQTGLRRSDLEMALKDLMQRQLLLPKRTHDGMCYELTYLGECAMQLPTTGGPLAFVRDWLTLHRAKLRYRLSAAKTENVSHNRRADDNQYVEKSGKRIATHE